MDCFVLDEWIRFIEKILNVVEVPDHEKAKLPHRRGKPW